MVWLFPAILMVVFLTAVVLKFSGLMEDMEKMAVEIEKVNRELTIELGSLRGEIQEGRDMVNENFKKWK